MANTLFSNRIGLNIRTDGDWEASKSPPYVKLDVVKSRGRLWAAANTPLADEMPGEGPNWVDWGVFAVDGLTLTKNAEGLARAVDVEVPGGTAKGFGQIGNAVHVFGEENSLDDLVHPGEYFVNEGVQGLPLGSNGHVSVKGADVNNDAYFKQRFQRRGTPGTNDYQRFERTGTISSGGVVSWGPWYDMRGSWFDAYSSADGTLGAYAFNVSSVVNESTGVYKLNLIHPVAAAQFVPFVTVYSSAAGYVGVAYRDTAEETLGYLWTIRICNASGTLTNAAFRVRT